MYDRATNRHQCSLFDCSPVSGSVGSGGCCRHAWRPDRRGRTEFRLPLLLGAFRFAALEAVIVNKAVSIVVVATALPFRAATVPLRDVGAHWPIILNLLAGSLLGAWLGAG